MIPAVVPLALQQLRDRLRDRRIRRAFWRAVTSRSGTGHPSLGEEYLDVREVQQIFGVAADHRTINADELHDLEEIVDHAQFAPGAAERLQRYLDDRRSRLPNVSASPLSGRQLDHVAEILEDESNVGRIAFVSHGTHMFYEPSNYRAIARLMREGDLSVYTFHCGVGAEYEALAETVGGRWYSGRNEMYVPESVFGFRNYRIRTIIHETTHVIQDFSNYTLRQDYYESDAFIAGAIAFFRGGRGVAEAGHGIYRAAYNAARSVQQGRAISAADYETVRQAVLASPSYASGETTVRSFGGADTSMASGDELRSLIRMMELEEMRRR